MKIVVALICLLSSCESILGQGKAQKFLSQLPPLPQDICSITDTEKEDYRNSIISVLNAVDAEIEQIEKQLPTQNQMRKSVSMETGVSKEKLSAIENSQNEEMGKKLVEQKMLSEYGISMNDIEDLEQMNEKEQKEWAENFAKNHTKSAGEIKKQRMDKANASESVQIAKLNQEILAYHEKWSEMTLELIKQEDLAKQELETCLENVRNNAPKPKYQGEHCVNEKAIEEYLAKNELACQTAYCNRISPLKIQTLNQKKADLPIMFSLITQLQTLQGDMLERQSGIDLYSNNVPDATELALVKEYAKDMYNIF